MGLEPGMATLRRLLAQELKDDRARIEALTALLRCRVLVATWPTSVESVRTLTNSDGEQAMPLFSERPELLAAARRFGWLQPDGSINSRELDARDALKGALAQGTQFVVLDICAKHVVEFEREEIASALAAPTRSSKPGVSRRPASRSKRPVKLAQLPVTASKRPAPFGEIDMPFVKERTSLMAVEDVVVRARAAARPDPRVEPALDAPGHAADEPAVPAMAPAASNKKRTSQRAARRRSSGRVSQAAARAASSLAASLLPAVAEPSIGMAAPPELPPFESSPSQRPAEGAAFNQAKPATLEAAAIVQQLVKMADDQAPQATTEVADMLKDLASKGHVEERRPSTAHAAARALVGTLSAGDPKRSKRGAPAKLRSEPKAKAVEEASEQQNAAEPGELRPLELRLEEALLAQISETLRKYPEVEWACEVADGSSTPVIGMRVEPTFLMRLDEIKTAVESAGESRGTPLSVLLLIDPQQMREARAQGAAFFPWRKRTPKS